MQLWPTCTRIYNHKERNNAGSEEAPPTCIKEAHPLSSDSAPAYIHPTAV